MDLGQAPAAGTIALIIVTAVITATISTLMGVFGKKVVESLLDWLLRPFRFVKETVYRWIAPRNLFSSSLRSYKRHISRSNLTRIENPVGPNLAVPLEHAFAPLKLISSDTQESIDLFSHTAISYRYIVLGGPGTGKTTLMKSLVTSVISGRPHKDLNVLIPVFIVLRNLAKKGHSVRQAIVSAFANYHFPGADRFIELALSQGKMLIILDGLDEVGASREDVASEILNFCEHDDQQEHRNRLIVTCRENSYRTQDLQSVIPEIVRVEPFANHHMRIFLQGWPEHKGRLAIKLYGQVQNDRQLRDICRNPLLLTILTGLYLDTDNFELPTSRDHFYKAAVEELLVCRPARRQIKQSFDADDKRQILERVALERLETVARHEDPEEFTREAIQQKAKEVLHQEKCDPRDLIKELVEINGIIKPSSEVNYTCVHRTFQEYFAAREARRTRETKEVIETFSNRPELIEVLYFYCGLVDNIPALTYIVGAFIDQERWLDAGRSLLYMKEVIDRILIERVTSELRKQVNSGAEFKAALEVLSSLAQRREPEFELARRLFSEAIDDLAAGYGEKGASALESALATAPEAAMKIIPSLLEHRSQRWKITAVQLLRDIGTDEALDQLVQLLKDRDTFIRAEAGKVLAGMVKSRNRDLRARATLLPERMDAAIWPLETYFPGTLAIPIAESLSNSAETSNAAINCAIRAVNIAKNDSLGDSEHFFIKKWRKLPRDFTIQNYMRYAAGVFIKGALSLIFMITFFLNTFLLWGYFNDEALLLTANPVQGHRLKIGLIIQRIEDQARLIVHDIEQRLPSNASGWLRVLPWNWQVEPIIPDDKVEAFNLIENWVRGEGYWRVDPYKILADSPKLNILSEIELHGEITQLQSIIRDLRQQLPDLHGASYLILATPKIVYLIAYLLFLFSWLLLLVFPGEESPKKRLDQTNPTRKYTFYSDIIVGIVIMAVICLFPTLFFSGTKLLYVIAIAISTLPTFCIVMGTLLRITHWPNNRFISVINDVVPL